MSIAVLVPTRGRPDWAMETARALRDLAQSESATIVLGWDTDEQAVYQEALERLGRGGPGRIVVSVADREDTLGAKVNRLKRDAGKHDYYMFFPDKLLMLTRGWDEGIHEAFRRLPDPYFFLHATDNTTPDGLNFCSCPIMADVLLERMSGGKFFPEYFPFWFGDTWIDEIATWLSRRVRIEGVEFRSHWYGGVVKDRRGTHRMREVSWWARAFMHLAGERFDWANRVLGAIAEHEWARRARSWVLLTERPGNWYAEAAGGEDAGYARARKAMEEQIRAALAAQRQP